MHLNRIATAGVMSASIAHELNQPLGAILTNAEAAKNLLARKPLDVDRIREIVDDIHRDDQRAAGIIRQLRGLLKRKEIELQEFDLNALVANTLHILQPEAAKRGITLSSKQASGSLLVRADQVHLQQVLLNLGVNGIDAAECSEHRERSLAFETARNGNSQAEVSISDSGHGVPSEELEGIFETFFTTKPQGTGLGLSIARTIVETYGGKVWAENRPSGRRHVSIHVAARKGACLMTSARPSVHVVDDDASFRTSIGRMLESVGYEVALYDSGKTYLEKFLLEDEPGCILLDLKMASLGGLEVQQRLSSLGSVSSVIFLTGHGDIPTSVQAIKDGADNFLTKPVAQDTLIEAIERAFVRFAEKRRQRDRLNELGRARLSTDAARKGGF